MLYFASTYVYGWQALGMNCHAWYAGGRFTGARRGYAGTCDIGQRQQPGHVRITAAHAEQPAGLLAGA